VERPWKVIPKVLDHTTDILMRCHPKHYGEAMEQLNGKKLLEVVEDIRSHLAWIKFALLMIAGAAIQASCVYVNQ